MKSTCFFITNPRFQSFQFFSNLLNTQQRISQLQTVEIRAKYGQRIRSIILLPFQCSINNSKEDPLVIRKQSPLSLRNFPLKPLFLAFLSNFFQSSLLSLWASLWCMAIEAFRSIPTKRLVDCRPDRGCQFVEHHRRRAGSDIACGDRI